MPYCQHCGEEVDSSADVCPKCGERLETETEVASQSTDSASGPKAPTGIKIICVIAGIGAIFAIIGGWGMTQMAGSYYVPEWFGLLGVISIMGGFVNFPMIYGLWTMKSWGWKLAIVLYSLNVIMNIIAILSGNVRSIIGLIIAIVIIWYVHGKKDMYLKDTDELNISMRNFGTD